MERGQQARPVQRPRRRPAGAHGPADAWLQPYTLQPMPKLNTREKAELTAFRSAENASPATPLSLTEDQE
eukprot:2443113-Prymnesium_polylepis.1